jgi:hypothetical protein
MRYYMRLNETLHIQQVGIIEKNLRKIKRTKIWVVSNI